MVKIPDIDQITGGRLAATPNVKPNTQLTNQLTLPYAQVAKTVTDTGSLLAEYSMQIQDSRDKTLINNLTLESQRVLQTYEQELYSGKLQPDGSYKQYDPLDYDTLLFDFKNELIKKNVINNESIKSSYVRDTLKSKINLSYLDIQSKVLKEKNERIEKEYIISTMGSIDQLTVDFTKIDTSKTETIDTQIEKINLEFYEQLNGIKNFVSAESLLKIESDFWYNTAKSHLVEITQNMSATDVVAYTKTVDGYPNKTASNNLDTFLLSKNEPYEVEKILTAVIKQKSDEITFQKKIDDEQEKVIDKKKLELERIIFLGNTDEDLTEMLDAFETAKTLDFSYDELRAMEDIVEKKNIYRKTSVETIHSDLIKQSFFGTLSFEDITDNAMNLSKNDAEALMTKVGSNMAAEERRIMKKVLTAIGITEDQFQYGTTAFINAVSLNMFDVINKSENYLNENRNLFGTTEYNQEINKLLNEAFQNIKQDVFDLLINNLEKNPTDLTRAITIENIGSITKQLQDFKRAEQEADNWNSDTSYQPIPGFTIKGSEINKTITQLMDQQKQIASIERIESVILKGSTK